MPPKRAPNKTGGDLKSNVRQASAANKQWKREDRKIKWREEQQHKRREARSRAEAERRWHQSIRNKKSRAVGQKGKQVFTATSVASTSNKFNNNDNKNITSNNINNNTSNSNNSNSSSSTSTSNNGCSQTTSLEHTEVSSYTYGTSLNVDKRYNYGYGYCGGYDGYSQSYRQALAMHGYFGGTSVIAETQGNKNLQSNVSTQEPKLCPVSSGSDKSKSIDIQETLDQINKSMKPQNQTRIYKDLDGMLGVRRRYDIEADMRRQYGYYKDFDGIVTVEELKQEDLDEVGMGPTSVLKDAHDDVNAVDKTQQQSHGGSKGTPTIGAALDQKSNDKTAEWKPARYQDFDNCMVKKKDKKSRKQRNKHTALAVPDAVKTRQTTYSRDQVSYHDNMFDDNVDTMDDLDIYSQSGSFGFTQTKKQTL